MVVDGGLASTCVLEQCYDGMYSHLRLWSYDYLFREKSDIGHMYCVCLSIS